MSEFSERMEYFVGKVCTIFVKPVARSFTDEQFTNYFVGVVDFLDEEGTQISNLQTGCLSYFPFQHIIGICEEQVIYPDNPEDVEVMEEFEEKPEEIKPSSQYIDVEALTKLSNLAKGKLGNT